MKSYKITLPNGKAFTFISDVEFEDIPEAIRERFLILPAAIECLDGSGKIVKPVSRETQAGLPPKAE